MKASERGRCEGRGMGWEAMHGENVSYLKLLTDDPTSLEGSGISSAILIPHSSPLVQPSHTPTKRYGLYVCVVHRYSTPEVTFLTMSINSIKNT